MLSTAFQLPPNFSIASSSLSSSTYLSSSSSSPTASSSSSPSSSPSPPTTSRRSSSSQRPHRCSSSSSLSSTSSKVVTTRRRPTASNPPLLGAFCRLPFCLLFLLLLVLCAASADSLHPPPSSSSSSSSSSDSTMNHRHTRSNGDSGGGNGEPTSYSRSSSSSSSSSPSSSSSSSSRSDFFLHDQPPREVPQGVQTPDDWHSQSQDRIKFLRAQNDQYLQLHNGMVTGTLQERPDYGIVRFNTHVNHVIIQSFIDPHYLCMNSSGRLYLSKSLSQDCYMKERSLYPNGSYWLYYEFVHHSRPDRKLLLGVDCDSLPGYEANASNQTSRFMYDKVPEEQIKALKQMLQVSQRPAPAEKCTPQPWRAPEKDRRALRQKLKARWCWNIKRISRNTKYIRNCYKKHKQCQAPSELGPADAARPPRAKICVCDILRQMMRKPKRAKRKCLIRKVERYLTHRKLRPDLRRIKLLAQALLKHYQAISRRIRNLTKKKRQREKKDGAAVASEEAEGQDHYPVLKRKRKKSRHRIVKLNQLLDKYQSELVLPPGAESGSGSAGGQSAAGSDGSAPTLSPEFKADLEQLSPKRHRTRHPRKHKGRRRRRRQMARKQKRKLAISSAPD
ncbi:uncharacterized protein LOC101853120 [Aplysia californica]|uniref:Uncharacterized protein LOC101853120 n=1 Tax=Aplysia californica TaxID=6500 RepID=A0ABM0K4A0_APLCA|nr:uncharacterized protein LOC101853120 [Aplysia californica]